MTSAVGFSVSAEEYAELQQAREKAAERRANACKSAALRAKRIRDGIRRAVSQLPGNSRELGHANLTRQVREWIKLKGPEWFDLSNVPDRRTIESVIDEMAREREHDAASCKPVVACWWHPINTEPSA